MNDRQIPYEFIKANCSLNWKDVVWGYERQLIGWRDVVNMAVDDVASGGDTEMLIKLAAADKQDAGQVGDMVRALAATETNSDEGRTRRKWLYLVLAWLFDHRRGYEDPLSEIESVYADFDYPVEIKEFVRYMPVANGYDPSKYTKKENEERLFSLWEAYLKKFKGELTGLK